MWAKGKLLVISLALHFECFATANLNSSSPSTVLSILTGRVFSSLGLELIFLFHISHDANVDSYRWVFFPSHPLSLLALFFFEVRLSLLFLLFMKVFKVGTGLEEIKVKLYVAIPAVAHSALPFLLLIESDVEERVSVLLDVEFPQFTQNLKVSFTTLPQ